jgi:hypothetical protein
MLLPASGASGLFRYISLAIFLSPFLASFPVLTCDDPWNEPNTSRHPFAVCHVKIQDFSSFSYKAWMLMDSQKVGEVDKAETDPDGSLHIQRKYEEQSPNHCILVCKLPIFRP